MKEIIFFEKLKNEFIEEFTKHRCGNFTKSDLEEGFTLGYYGKPAPKKYHAFLAWQAGKRHAGIF